MDKPKSCKSLIFNVSLEIDPSLTNVLKCFFSKFTISTTGLSFSLKPFAKATILAALSIAPLNKTALTVAEDIPSMEPAPSVLSRLTLVGTLISKPLY